MNESGVTAYTELLPCPALSRLVECYWEIRTEKICDSSWNSFLFSPDCTFDVIISSDGFVLSYANGQKSFQNSNAQILGQKTKSVRLELPNDSIIRGIRFKPFAFAKTLPSCHQILLDRSVDVANLFKCTSLNEIRTEHTLRKESLSAVKDDLEILTFEILRNEIDVDEEFRAQLNYVLDRKGVVLINDMTKEFGYSKVTLRNNFKRKLGLTPKNVARIWRLNFFLELHKSQPHWNYTTLAMESGYYDQAHLIREFKSFFQLSPKRFFRTHKDEIVLSQEIIQKRFTRYYDPVM